MQHSCAVIGMHNLGMILHAVKLLLCILHCSNRTSDRMRRNTESIWNLRNIIGVTHPSSSLFRKPFKQKTILLKTGFCLTVFARRRCSYGSAQLICHQLCTVANSKDRNAERKNFRIDMRRAFSVDAVWSAGKNNADWMHLFYPRNCYFIIGVDFTVYVAFAYTPCNQLIILSAEIDNQNRFVVHKGASCNLFSNNAKRRYQYTLYFAMFPYGLQVPLQIK